MVHGFLVGKNANEDVGVDSPAEDLQMRTLLKALKMYNRNVGLMIFGINAQ